MAWKTEMVAACILKLELPLGEYQVAEMMTRVDAHSYRNIYLGGGAEIVSACLQSSIMHNHVCTPIYPKD